MLGVLPIPFVLQRLLHMCLLARMYVCRILARPGSFFYFGFNSGWLVEAVLNRADAFLLLTISDSVCHQVSAPQAF